MKVTDSIIRMTKECSPAVGKVLLEQYQNIPYVVRDAVDGFYEALERIEDRDSISAIKESLNKLGEACEANPTYRDVYEAAKKEAQDEIAEIIANEGMTLFDEDE